MRKHHIKHCAIQPQYYEDKFTKSKIHRLKTHANIHIPFLNYNCTFTRTYTVKIFFNTFVFEQYASYFPVKTLQHRVFAFTPRRAPCFLVYITSLLNERKL